MNLRYPDLYAQKWVEGIGWVLHPISYFSLLEDFSLVWEKDGGWNRMRFEKAYDWIEANVV